MSGELEGRGWQGVTDSDLINLIPAVKHESAQRREIGFRPGMGRGN